MFDAIPRVSFLFWIDLDRCQTLNIEFQLIVSMFGHIFPTFRNIPPIWLSILFLGQDDPQSPDRNDFGKLRQRPTALKEFLERNRSLDFGVPP